LARAQNDCNNQIMTPDICHNATITDTIMDVVREAWIRYDGDNVGTISRIWTGITRFNATHFSNGKWFTRTDLGAAIFLANFLTNLV
jgi:hypothetical protein